MKLNLKLKWVVILTLLVSLPLPALARFISVDPQADQYPSLSPYVYCANNPLKFVDPDGNGIVVPKSVQDQSERMWKMSPVAGVAYDMAMDPSNCMMVGGISGPVVKPAAGGLRGLLSRVARRVLGKTDDAASVNPMKRGLENEAKILEQEGLTKNTRKVTTSEGSSIPDAITDNAIIEIKDVKYLSDTKQLRIQKEAARAAGKEHLTYTGKKTNVSKSMRKTQETTIKKTKELGPQD